MFEILLAFTVEAYIELREDAKKNDATQLEMWRVHHSKTSTYFEGLKLHFCGTGE